MLDFEWDADKNQANIDKHGIAFDLAIQIFNGDTLTYQDTRFDYDEVRMISIGPLSKRLMISVVHTKRGDKTRIISARHASREERRNYHEKIYPPLDD